MISLPDIEFPIIRRDRGPTPPIFSTDSFCCRIVLNILCIFATVRIFLRILSFFSFWDFFLPCKRAIICVGVAPECTSERKHKIHFLKHSSENGIRLRLYNTNNGCRIQVRHSKNKNVDFINPFPVCATAPTCHNSIATTKTVTCPSHM